MHFALLLLLLSLFNSSSNQQQQQDVFQLSPPERIPISRIRVVAAVGDSVTAAFAAKSDFIGKQPFLNATIENRGSSFSMGGDANETTLPNFIKRYLEKDHLLIGSSVGSHSASICHGWFCPGKMDPKLDQLNAAQTGAFASSNLQTQVDYLIDQINSHPLINPVTDVKLISVFIGGNDLCSACVSPTSSYSPQTFKTNVKSAIDRLKASFPSNTIVNLIHLFNISQIYDLTHADPHCQQLRRAGFAFTCTCAFQMGDDWRKWTDQLATQYNEKLREIVKEEEQYWSFSGVGLWNEYFSIPFVVTSDPGFSQIDIRSWPMDYMSRLDCFHPSAAAHRLFAISVWNNLQRRFVEKKTSVDMGDLPDLPEAEAAFIYLS